ncbi:recombinase XerC [Tepidimonas fonticaldi]|uniref:Tyrosine recombinase XerC n=1 Tax=Tepidimonas fonticaldi TaxID=1101373 RepID=A0A1A6DS86_9BURK|nr:tyrosine-type recombinase/integrase [Tepidimonas fonticaldi]OBS29718.1 recombinase XerC [Tepidimonas fonticaldi]
MDAATDDLALIADYLTHVRVEKRLAARTQALYAEHLHDLYHRAQAEGTGLKAVTPSQARRWVAQLHAAGRQPRGIALVVSSWRGFYDWMGRTGGIDRHPLQGVRPPKAGKPLPKALAVEEALRLAQGPGQAVSGDRAAEALAHAQRRGDRAMVELLYGSGLRLGELLGLDVQAGPHARGWVDAQAGEAHVCGKGGKWRTVPVGGPALAALADWLSVRAQLLRLPDEPALFVGARGERLTPQVARRRLAAWAAEAGVPVHVHPHMLRHSFASHVLQSSGDLRGVQELLGHASIASTQIYTRLDFQDLSRVYEAAHPRARRGAGDAAGPGAAESTPPAAAGNPDG